MPRQFNNRGGPFKGGNARWSHDKYDDGDDNRERGGWNKSNKIQRKVSFKATVKNNKLNDLKIRAALEDDDDMNEASGSQGGEMFYRGKNRRRKGSPIPKNFNRQPFRKLIVGPTGWYQVLIPHGHKYEKDFILKSLLNVTSPDIFIPHYYKIDEDGKNALFFLDDYKMAEKIMRADRSIQMPDGFKMIIKVRSSVPQSQVDATMKERMKNAMGKRYSPATKALDLTKFHADPDLSDIFVGLFRPVVMTAAIEIIAENIPDLEALNLNDNKINQMDHFKTLTSKLPQIKVLYLGDNKITNSLALDSLKGLPLVELVLAGNPFKNRMKDETAYISDIRKRFPKLMKLDGKELPPEIGFDISSEVQLPLAKASFLCDPAGAPIVRQFLEQYFILYDSTNRQQLLDAYHENAILSLTATWNQHATQAQRLTTYINCSRNLFRIKESDARFRHLRRGRLQVVSFLQDLPPTKHDPMSFAVDLTLFTPKIIQLTVTGVFKEVHSDPKQEYVRSFQRSLIIVPNNNGFCILNELFHVNNASSKQERFAFKGPSLGETTQQRIEHQQAPMSSSQVQPIDDATKMQMIQLMAQHSNMNLEWSRKCLEETQWDYQRAAHAFTELHKQNKIPPEAFVK